jgi:hypothetical protein
LLARKDNPLTSRSELGFSNQKKLRLIVVWIYFCKSMTGSQPASLTLAMSLKSQIAKRSSSSARNECRKWVRLSAPP